MNSNHPVILVSTSLRGLFLVLLIAAEMHGPDYEGLRRLCAELAE